MIAQKKSPFSSRLHQQQSKESFFFLIHLLFNAVNCKQGWHVIIIINSTSTSHLPAPQFLELLAKVAIAEVQETKHMQEDAHSPLSIEIQHSAGLGCLESIAAVSCGISLLREAPAVDWPAYQMQRADPMALVTALIKQGTLLRLIHLNQVQSGRIWSLACSPDQASASPQLRLPLFLFSPGAEHIDSSWLVTQHLY
jgi:hypothetical protein